jgi:hypothetical protein
MGAPAAAETHPNETHQNASNLCATRPDVKRRREFLLAKLAECIVTEAAV